MAVLITSVSFQVKKKLGDTVFALSFTHGTYFPIDVESVILDHTISEYIFSRVADLYRGLQSLRDVK